MLNKNTKKITTLAMLCAMAFVCVVCIRIPIFPAATFLTYEPKDAIIAIGGFIFGPACVVMMAAVVAVAEMVTISSTGLIGMVMNILSTVCFAATASYVYTRKRTLPMAIAGLVLGVIFQCSVMLLWNYFITPFYMGIPRSAIAQMLLPVFLPFNLIKSTANSVITMLIYKPAVNALRRASLIPHADTSKKLSPAVAIICILLLAALGILVFVLKKTL